MKKFKKIILIIICIFWAICQFTNKVYCYTIDEVKEKIDFKIVQETEEPEEYDILIDARDMIDNEQLPCIETSIESVIYDEDQILDVDFFNVISSKNGDEEWNTIQNVVQTVFKITLYIGIAMMITLLIYMAIIIVRSAISKKESIVSLPLSDVFGIGKGKASPKKHMTEKSFVEQWIISTCMLIFIVYILNLTISFSNVLINITDKLKPNEKEDDSIVVYVKNSQETVHLSSVVGSSLGNATSLSADISNYINTEGSTGKWAVYAKNLSSGTEAVTYNNTNQMSSASVIKLFIAAAAYEKASSDSGYTVNESDMSKMITVSDNDAANSFIDTLGMEYINSYISSNGYTSTKLNRRMLDTSSKDNYTSASDVGKLLEKIYNNECAGASNILEYMKQQQRKSKIPSGVPNGVEIANKTGELGGDYANGPVENDAAIIYKENANYILVILSSNLGDDGKAISNITEISSRVYNGIDGGLSRTSSNVDATTTRTFDYYFKTNLEGLLMFQSQYNWEDYAGKNVINMCTGMLLSGFKVALYGVLWLRMIAVAGLTMLAPIVVLINAFMRIRGNAGLLLNWFKLYLYCVFLRPFISIIYYIFIKSNTYNVSEHPYFVLFVIAGISIIVIWSFVKLLRSMNILKKKNKAKNKVK